MLIFGRALHRCIPLLGLPLLASAQRADAQLLSPRTVPVQQGQQFEIFPSARAGSSVAALAVEDTLLGPFRNPATASRAQRPTFDITRYGHDVNRDRGGGSTMSIAALMPSGAWSFGGQYAHQRLELARLRWPEPIERRVNQYASGLVSRRVGQRLALGAGAQWSRLGALDGLHLLYAGTDRAVVSGESVDLRIGATREWSGEQIVDVVLLHHRYRSTHAVHYPEVRGTTDPFIPPVVITPARIERHHDDVLTSGAHVEYRQPIGTGKWRLGAVATFNRRFHPKIPQYELERVVPIPRDPGRTDGFNAGMGLARVSDRLVVAADVLIEPMFSHTWANAERDTILPTGRVLRYGAHTVDNRFRFANHRVRVSLANRWFDVNPSTWVGFQAGLDVYSLDYRLNQRDHVSSTSRRLDAEWNELTSVFGLRLVSRDFLASYHFSLSCQDVCPQIGGAPLRAENLSGGILAAPSAPFTRPDGVVTRHRFGITITR